MISHDIMRYDMLSYQNDNISQIINSHNAYIQTQYERLKRLMSSGVANVESLLKLIVLRLDSKSSYTRSHLIRAR